MKKQRLSMLLEDLPDSGLIRGVNIDMSQHCKNVEAWALKKEYHHTEGTYQKGL